MKTVTIHRCPVSEAIKAHTDEVAHVLRNEGLEVMVVDGNRGEFSVLLGEMELARNLLELPSAETILATVHHLEEAVMS